MSEQDKYGSVGEEIWLVEEDDEDDGAEDQYSVPQSVVSEEEEEEEEDDDDEDEVDRKSRKKSLLMVYKHDYGPVIYSLYAFNVEEAVYARPLPDPRLFPLTLIQLLRADYPLGMGFVFLNSSNTLYMMGGQFKKNGVTYSSKKVFYLDLTPLMATTSSLPLLSVKEAPNMNAGKSNPIAFAADDGNIYVLSCVIGRSFEAYSNNLCPLSFNESEDMTPVLDDVEPETKFEVFNPQSGTWTVLPDPPHYEFSRYPSSICGDASVRNKIFIISFEDVYYFDTKKSTWVFYPYRHDFATEKDVDSRLVHAFKGDRFLGRAAIADDQDYYHTVVAFNKSLNAARVYRIPTSEADTYLPFGALRNLKVEFNCRFDPSAG